MRRSAMQLWLGSMLAVLLCLPGCFTMHHTVGAGPVSGTEVSDTQWFALWGLVSMGDVDSADLAGGTMDYRVTTKFTFVDVILSSLTSFLTFYRQTIIVEK